MKPSIADQPANSSTIFFLKFRAQLELTTNLLPHSFDFIFCIQNQECSKELLQKYFRLKKGIRRVRLIRKVFQARCARNRGSAARGASTPPNRGEYAPPRALSRAKCRREYAPEMRNAESQKDGCALFLPLAFSDFFGDS